MFHSFFSERRISIFLASASLLLQLVEDFLDLHLGDLVELGIEDGVGLDVVELESVDQLSRGVGLAVDFRG